MQTRDRMQKDVPRCVPHQRLLDALEIMGDRNITWVPVVEGLDDPRFLGWITALRAAVFLGVFDRRPSEAFCRELIEEPPAVLDPDQGLEGARAVIAHWQLRRLPVVQSGRLLGELWLDK